MKEPVDYMFDILSWVLFTPAAITSNSKYKAVRIIGLISCIPFILTWYFTITPISLAIIILLIFQILKDI